jgi:hypothetical protein
MCPTARSQSVPFTGRPPRDHKAQIRLEGLSKYTHTATRERLVDRLIER